MDINELLILEKRIDPIVAKIEVNFSFDIIKTTHAEDRSNFASRGLSGFNQNHISNAEMAEFVNWFKKSISEKIVSGEIVDQIEFVIKSKDRSLAMAIIPEEVSFTYWKLVIKTVFRESEEHIFKVGPDQLVIEK